MAPIIGRFGRSPARACAKVSARSSSDGPPDMNVPGLVRFSPGAIGHRAIEREIDAEKGLAPIVALDLAGDALAHLRLAKKIEREMERIDIRGDHAIQRNDLSVVEAD